jgi:ubiquinone/menaquinone biosynthesis C-methylase UbiE
MNETITSLDPTIRNFYDTRPEEHRLESGASQLEALRTRQLIQRFAPRRPCTVLDVGGAAGPYALWLSELGHRVHLVEPVPRLVLEAKRRSGGARVPIASFTRADARALPFASESVDFMLLLGPLYHLTSTADRARAWSEANSVL